MTGSVRDPRLIPRGLALLASLLALGAFVAPTSGAGGATLLVDPSTPGAFATIGDALAQAHPGDAVVVAAGTYAGGLVASVPDVTIRGASHERPPTILAAGSAIGLRVQADGVRLQDLRVAGGAGGILVDHANRFYASDVAVQDAAGNGFEARFCDVVTLERLAVSGSATNGVRLGACRAVSASALSLSGNLRALHAYEVTGLDLRGASATANAG